MTPLLIIGAGPFGLALSAHAKTHGIDQVIVGEPMAFWQRHMPPGMLLRSGCDWHLDPANRLTFNHYLAEKNLTCDDIRPVTLARYLDYIDWFITQSGVHVSPKRVAQLESTAIGWRARMDDGSEIVARNVVVAVGFGLFKHLPADLMRLLPAGSFTHTTDLTDFATMRGKRCIVIGGRQAAFEWSALLREAGAVTVDVCYRHETPAFATSDWSWVPPLLDRMAAEPSWYSSLSQPERDALAQRFWSEGRSKLEPWLAARVHRDGITLHPRSSVVACAQENGPLKVTLDNGDVVKADHIVLATGYKANGRDVPFLREVAEQLNVRDGYPILDDGFQSSAPGLYFTSILAAGSFGPFFGFTVAARFAAERIVNVMR